MLDMLKERKAALEAQGKKGFTLMEMLIVIAIIAILIAIAIPIFTAQLENARDSTSIANIRSAYAEAQAAYLTHMNDTVTAEGNATIARSDGSITSIAIANVAIETQQDNEWSGQGANVSFVGTATGQITESAFNALDTGAAIAGSKTVTFSYGNNGIITGIAFS